MYVCQHPCGWHTWVKASLGSENLLFLLRYAAQMESRWQDIQYVPGQIYNVKELLHWLINFCIKYHRAEVN